MFTSPHPLRDAAFDREAATHVAIRRTHARRAALAVGLALALLALPWMVPDEVGIRAMPAAAGAVADPAGVGAPAAGGVVPMQPAAPEEAAGDTMSPDLSLG